MVQNKTSVGREMQNGADAQSMTGKVVLVTGATDGIGKVTALELARMGATVVGVGRSVEKCAAVERELRAVSGNPSVEMIAADLSTCAGVQRAAACFRAGHRRLDVLVNNAGALRYARELSADGVEKTWALNHLNYFFLTHLLLDMLKLSAPSRVVNVSSEAHRKGALDLLEDPQSVSGWKAYGQSKLANILFSNELARRLEGTGVTSNSLHPGFVASQFGHTGSRLIGSVMRVIQKVGAISPEEGARTSIYLASAPEVEGVTGKYFVRSQPATPSATALDRAAALRLWQHSEELLGIGVPVR